MLVEELAGRGVEADDRLVRVDQVAVGRLAVALGPEAVEEPERLVRLESVGAEHVAEELLGPALGAQLLDPGREASGRGRGFGAGFGRIRRLLGEVGQEGEARQDDADDRQGRRCARSSAGRRRDEDHALGVAGNLVEVAHQHRLPAARRSPVGTAAHIPWSSWRRKASIRRASSSASSGSPSASSCVAVAWLHADELHVPIMSAADRRPPGDSRARRPGPGPAPTSRSPAAIASPARRRASIAASRSGNADRQQRRERRAVGAARAVGGPVGVHRSRRSRALPHRRRAGRSPSAWPPVTITARGAERADRRRQLARRSRSGPSPASARASGRFGVTTLASGSTRSTSAPRASSSSRLGAALGDHHRIDHDRRVADKARASTTASIVARVPSIPTFTASTPMSAATAATWATMTSGGTAWIAVDADGVLRRDRGDRGRAVDARRRRTPSGRPGSRRRLRSRSRRSPGRRVSAARSFAAILDKPPRPSRLRAGNARVVRSSGRRGRRARNRRARAGRG